MKNQIHVVLDKKRRLQYRLRIGIMEEVMRLKIYLATINMSVKDFGKIINYNPNYVSRVSSGDLQPGKKFVEAVKQVTGGEVILEEGKDWQKKNKAA